MFLNIKNKSLFLFKLAGLALLVAFISASNTETVSKETVMDLALLYILCKVAFYTRLLTIKLEEKVKEVKPYFFILGMTLLSYVYGTPNPNQLNR